MGWLGAYDHMLQINLWKFQSKLDLWMMDNSCRNDEMHSQYSWVVGNSTTKKGGCIKQTLKAIYFFSKINHRTISTQYNNDLTILVLTVHMLLFTLVACIYIFTIISVLIIKVKKKKIKLVVSLSHKLSMVIFLITILLSDFWLNATKSPKQRSWQDKRVLWKKLSSRLL